MSNPVINSSALAQMIAIAASALESKAMQIITTEETKVSNDLAKTADTLRQGLDRIELIALNAAATSLLNTYNTLFPPASATAATTETVATDPSTSAPQGS